MSGRTRFGSASWTDPTLVNFSDFYPAEANTPEARLRFYASRFDMVEVDSTYYALSYEKNSSLWVERTPDDFKFNIKAYRVFTLHQTPLKALPADLRDEVGSTVNSKGNVHFGDLPPRVLDELWQRFKDGLEPLRAAGKLGYILVQLPPWAMKNKANLNHLALCADRLDGYTLAVEFRNATWFKEGERREVTGFLREQNLAFVIVDEPQGAFNSVPALWESTSPDLAVVRFHGRNSETWNKKNISAAERFDYLYSEDELKEFVEPIKRLAAESREVHAVFNNCYSDKGVTNARQLRELYTGLYP